MKQRLLFIGPPGAGKGTQADLLCEKQEFLHLSTGDLLRAEVKAATSLGLEAAQVMNAGGLVSDALVLSIVEKKLVIKSEGWLLDGFPRTLIQAEALQILLEKINQPIDAVVVIQVKDDLLVKRLLARGRSDDSEEVIRNRLQVYKEKTSPLVDYYNKQGLIKSVDGDGDVLAIASRIEKLLC